MTEIFTVGHSNKPVESFIELLTAADISVLVDVRSVPWSRYNPQFNENALKIELRKVGIHYVSRGKNLRSRLLSRGCSIWMLCRSRRFGRTSG